MPDKIKDNLVKILEPEVKDSLTLPQGALIAIINKFDLTGCFVREKSGAEDKKRFGRLIELIIKIKELENDSKQKEAILTAIPNAECTSTFCFLHENSDFYIPYLVNNLRGNYDVALCNKLIKHLNDCFSCMSGFSDVMRDYHRQYSRFKQG